MIQVKQTKVLVTGSNGQVGTCLVEQLSARSDVELLAVDKCVLDITNQNSVSELVNKFKPNFIINAAAYTAVDNAETEVELSYAINELGPKYLAEAADVVNAIIIHISTDYVFDGKKIGTYSEEDKTNPQSIYGKSKRAGEIAVKKATRNHIILRTSWVFSEYGANFVKTMISQAENKRKLRIVGDQYGGPTYAGDVAKTIIQMIQSFSKTHDFQGGIYHYSGLPQLSWSEFAIHIFSNALEQGVITKSPILSSIASEDYLTKAKRPKNSKLELKKIERDFLIAPSDWKKAIMDLSKYKG